MLHQVPPDDRIPRREWLRHGAAGLGMVALSSLLGNAARPATRSPLVGRAKSVIWLFMNGGPSGIDLLDHKPQLERYDGQPFPGEIRTLFRYPGPIMRSPFTFQRYGDSGMTVSDVLPSFAQHVDKITLLKACVSQEQNHVPACYMANSGAPRGGMPHIGSWASYGLGQISNDLPSFVVMCDHRSAPEGGSNLWSSGYLPGQHQGIPLSSGPQPMTYLRPPEDLSDQTQRAQMQLLQRWNQRHLEQRGLDSALEARMRTLESAFRMQASLPEVADLTEETLATHKLYGLNHRPSHRFGRQCLTARRLVERGVPFIQIYHGGYENNWDQHGDLAEGHRQMAGEVDQPIAGLLADLDQRGLLDSTLVIWGGEFGRGPTAQDRNGRDHNPYGFCMWMAGGGVRRGYSYGETDEFGYLPVEHPVNMHDLHATILHLLGIDDASLTYRFGGREQTPTNGLGTVVRDILA